ncbi:MAG: hypothetical protein JNK72_10310 [Myxococcales bacterium]|nr:hypothetical protein [Myxococcales bacterium]
MSDNDDSVRQFIAFDYDQKQSVQLLYSPPFPISLSEEMSDGVHFDSVEVVRECNGIFILNLTLFDPTRGSIGRMGEELLCFSAEAPRPPDLVSLEMLEIREATLWRKNACFTICWARHLGAPFHVFRSSSA